MNNRIAIFPGSFDPFHDGHLEVLRKIDNLFDKVYIAITFNDNKIERKTKLERKVYITDKTKIFKNIEVVINDDTLTAEFAKNLGCTYLIRGLRNEKDFLYELQLSDANNYINSDLITIFIPSDVSKRKISSTLIAEIEKIKKKAK